MPWLHNFGRIPEFQLPPHHGPRGIALYLTKSALGNDSVMCAGAGGTGSYKNTGRVIYDLGNAYGPSGFLDNGCSQVDEDPMNSTPPGPNYCRLRLWNNSIEECSLGPWGLASRTDTDNSIPISTSPVFRVLATNDTYATLQANSSNTIAPEMAIINVTCPETGIPSQPPTIFTQNEDIWPPLAENLTFPILSNLESLPLMITLAPGDTFIPGAATSSASNPDQTSQ